MDSIVGVGIENVVYLVVFFYGEVFVIGVDDVGVVLSCLC